MKSNNCCRHIDDDNEAGEEDARGREAGEKEKGEKTGAERGKTGVKTGRD